MSVVVSATTEDLYASASGTVSVPAASKAYRLKAIANRFVASGTKATLKLKVPKAALKAIKRALRGRKKVKASIKLTARDGAGNLTTWQTHGQAQALTPLGGAVPGTLRP